MGACFPAFLEPRRLAEKALAAVIQEACVHGISTRAVDDFVNTLGGTGVSKRQVSRHCVELDAEVQVFLTRQLEGQWPYPWFDAMYLKSCNPGQITSVATIVAVADSIDGRCPHARAIR